jgi:hypothetical protein
MPLDSATWAALALLLSTAGAAYTYLAWRRHGLAAGVRGLAFTLLPIAAWLTGTLRLAGQIVDDVTAWAARLAFSPFVWIGIVVAGVSVLLFGASATMKRRGIGVRERPTTKRGLERKQAEQVTASPTRQAAPRVSTDDDLADIEAILRKHGIK